MNHRTVSRRSPPLIAATRLFILVACSPLMANVPCQASMDSATLLEVAIGVILEDEG